MSFLWAIKNVLSSVIFLVLNVMSDFITFLSLVFSKLYEVKIWIQVVFTTNYFYETLKFKNKCAKFQKLPANLHFKKIFFKYPTS